MRFKLFNDVLKNTRKISGSRKVNKLLCEHNRICGQIIDYNKFWKNFYFTINYTLIPMNLMLLQQLLFEDLMLITFIMNLIFSVGYSLTHFVLNHLTASINREASKSHKYLQKLIIKILSSNDRKRKLKVIYFFYNFKGLFYQKKINFSVVIEHNGKSWRSESYHWILM
jgi:hypothetical protein